MDPYKQLDMTDPRVLKAFLNVRRRDDHYLVDSINVEGKKFIRQIPLYAGLVPITIATYKENRGSRRVQPRQVYVRFDKSTERIFSSE